MPGPTPTPLPTSNGSARGCMWWMSLADEELSQRVGQSRAVGADHVVAEQPDVVEAQCRRGVRIDHHRVPDQLRPPLDGGSDRQIDDGQEVLVERRALR